MTDDQGWSGGAGSGPGLQSLLQEMVATPSVNPSMEEGGAGEGAMAALTTSWLEAWGFDTRKAEVAPGRFNVIAWSRGSAPGPTLLFNGHLDTVGVEGMSIDPFLGEVREGRLFGRGSCDMKGGIASLLGAAARLRQTGHAGSLLVALTADEEDASIGMQSLVADGIQADAAIVCEPTSLAVMPANKGFVWVEASFRGRAAHGSRPEEGRDAIRHAGEFLASLGEMEAILEAGRPHPLLGYGTVHAGTIRGGSAPSVYPDRCSLVLERRTLPGEDDGAVMGELVALAEALKARNPEVDVRMDLRLSRPGTEVPETHPLVQGLLAALRSETVAGRVEGMTAWVDAALLNEAGIPSVCFGPGSIGKAHSADEWIPLEEVELAARVLERFARDFLG
jgi:acetylornithine deacetylase